MTEHHDHDVERRRARMIALYLALVAIGISVARHAPVPESPPVRPRAVTVPVPGWQINPSISPDGSRVAFATRSDAGDSRLWLWSRATGSWEPISEPGSFEGRPAISNDGARLAFWRAARWQLEMTDRSLASGFERIVTTLPSPEFLDPSFLPGVSWAPDQKAIAFSSGDASGSIGINLVIPETGTLRRVTNPPTNVIDCDPQFSPDGVSISFTRFVSPGDSDVWVVDLEERVERRLTHDRRNVLGHAWASDGKTLAIASNRLGRFEIWNLPLDGGPPRWAGLRANLSNPSMSRDGAMVAEEWIYDTNLWRVGEGGSPIRLTSFEGWDGSPRFSPSGERIAFVTNRSGSWEVWIANPDGSAPERLVGEIGPLDAPSWSPDGNEIAVHSIRTEGVDIFVASAVDGSWRRLTNDGSENVYPSWSPDGRWICFGSNRGGEWNIWRIPAKGGDAEQITFEGGYRCQMVDGGGLFFTRPGQRGLWSLTAGMEALVTERIAAEDNVNWRVSSDGLSFLERIADGSVVARRVTFGGEIVGSLVLDPAPIPHNGSFDVSPKDGSVVWCRLDDQKSRVLVIPPGGN